jgi:hypothetical protein
MLSSLVHHKLFLASSLSPFIGVLMADKTEKELKAWLSGAKIALLLVEPKSMEFGEGLTAEVEAAARAGLSLN